jgi:hypothetical protein
MSTPNEHKISGGVSVQIERLILDGISLTPNEQSLFRTALETELTRQFAAGQLELRPEGAVPSLPAQSIRTRGVLSPVALGEQIGAAVFGALKK